MTKQEYILYRNPLEHHHIDDMSIRVMYEYYKELSGDEQISLKEFSEKFIMYLNMGNRPVMDSINDAKVYFDNKFGITKLFDKNGKLIKVY